MTSEYKTEENKVIAKFKETRSIYHVNPLGMRILVRIPDEANRTDGGLFIPDSAKESMSESVIAEVIEVASAVDSDTHEEANVSGIPLGAKVLIDKNMGIKVPWDSRLRIVETKNVLAIVEKIKLT